MELLETANKLGTNDPITVEFSYGGDPKATFWVSPTAGAAKGADQAATDMQTTVRKSTATTVGFANTYRIVNATLDKSTSCWLLYIDFV